MNAQVEDVCTLYPDEDVCGLRPDDMKACVEDVCGLYPDEPLEKYEHFKSRDPRITSPVDIEEKLGPVLRKYAKKITWSFFKYEKPLGVGNEITPAEIDWKNIDRVYHLETGMSDDQYTELIFSMPITNRRVYMILTLLWCPCENAACDMVLMGEVLASANPPKFFHSILDLKKYGTPFHSMLAMDHRTIRKIKDFLRDDGIYLVQN